MTVLFMHTAAEGIIEGLLVTVVLNNALDWLVDDVTSGGLEGELNWVLDRVLDGRLDVVLD